MKSRGGARGRGSASDPQPGDPDAVAEALCGAAPAVGVTLDRDTARRLVRFAEEILRWNRRVDLVGRLDLQRLAEGHLLDALALLPLLRARRIRRLADAGSGAGLPGLALATAEPGLQVISIEPRQRRVAFQRHAVRILGLRNAEVVQSRLEAAARAPVGPTVARVGAIRRGADLPGGPADAAVARAFAPLPALLGLLAPLVAQGGLVLAMRGPGGEEDGREAAAAATAAGLVLESAPRYTLGGLSQEAGRARVLLVYRARGEGPAGP